MVSVRVVAVVAAGGLGMALWGVSRAQEAAPANAPAAASAGPALPEHADTAAAEQLPGETLTDPNTDPHADADGAAAEEAVATVEDAPTSMMAAFFDGLALDTIDQKVEAFYDPAATLEDPFGRYEHRTGIATHLKALLKGTKSVAFEVRSEFQSGDETVTLWTVSVLHDSLGDEPVVVEGVTHARFVNDKIAEQHDYYDVGGLVYERLTLIGPLVRWVKAKVAG